MTYWPASSSTTPRYAGPVSFFRLPTLSNPADADIALTTDGFQCSLLALSTRPDDSSASSPGSGLDAAAAALAAMTGGAGGRGASKGSGDDEERYRAGAALAPGAEGAAAPLEVRVRFGGGFRGELTHPTVCTQGGVGVAEGAAVDA